MRAQSYPHTLSLSPYLNQKNICMLSVIFGSESNFAKFGKSNYDLAIEKGRHAKLERHVRTFTMCDLGSIEDEYRFILISPKYDRLREKYLP